MQGPISHHDLRRCRYSCNRAKIRGAVVCVALLNRLNGDQIAATPADLASYSEHTITLVLNYVKAALEKEGYYAKR